MDCDVPFPFPPKKLGKFSLPPGQFKLLSDAVSFELQSADIRNKHP